MGNASKVVKHNLKSRALELLVKNKPEVVAEILTSELKAKEINDTISPSSVSRFWRKEREKREEKATAIFEDYLEKTLPADLELISNLTKFHQSIMDGKVPGVVIDGKATNIDAVVNGEKIQITFEDRKQAARDILRIMQVKLHHVGLQTGSEDDIDGHAVDLSRFKRQKTDTKDQIVNDK